MSIEYEMVPFGPEIVDAYARLFPGDHDKGETTLDWRFRDNPHGSAQFAVARDAGLIRGMIALVPTQLINGSQAISSFQAIDTIVDPELQGKFVFVRLGHLVEDYVAARGAMLWGFPNAAAARGWFGRLGWTRTGSAPFLIKPLRTGYVFRRLAPALGRLDLPLFVGRGRKADHTNPPIDDRYDRLWETVRNDLRIGVDRSGEWQRWRLAKPHAAYRWTFDDEGSAFVATRTTAKHGGIVAYVMEALGPPSNSKALTRLLRSELAELGASSKAEVALAWCGPPSPNYSSYRAAGFFPFPDRFRPAEIHHGYWTGDDARRSESAAAHWYLSYVDSDTV